MKVIENRDTSLDLVEIQTFNWYKSVLNANSEVIDNSTIKGLVRKALEEMVELALACDLKADEILMNTVDSLANQARKQGLWPSSLNSDNAHQDLKASLNAGSEIPDEIADVLMVILVLKRALDIRNDAVMDKLTVNRKTPPSEWHVSKNKLLYRKKVEGLL